MVSRGLAGRKGSVLSRCDTGHHTLEGKQALARAPLDIAGVVLAHNDGEGCAEIVKQAPFSPQLLCVSQLCQPSFILDLEVDLGGRHVGMCEIFCRGIRHVSPGP